MPIEYRIDLDAGVIFVEARDVIRFEEARAYCEGVVNDPDYRPGLNELADFRGARDTDISSTQMRTLRDINAQLSEHLAPGRIAHVVDTDLGYGLARMFSTLSDSSVMEHRVFRDISEAREWLGLKPAAAE